MNVKAREHADRWLAAWNGRDLDGVIDCYSDDVEFEAETVVRRWNRPDGRLQGREELRQHFQMGLDLAPELRFSEEAFLLAPSGYTLVYRRENGNLVADVVEQDSQGLARRVRAFYQERPR